MESEDQIIDSSYNTSSMNDNGEFNNLTALQIRLDTRPIIEDLELYLRGSKIVVVQKPDGTITTKKIDIGGLQRANEKGIQTILSLFSNIINSQSVQANFNDDRYENYIRDKHIELLELLIDNCENWEIDEDDIQPIINTAMSIIIPFMSRPVNNKERDSYSTTIQTKETSMVQPQKTQSAFNI